MEALFFCWNLLVNPSKSCVFGLRTALLCMCEYVRVGGGVSSRTCIILCRCRVLQEFTERLGYLVYGAYNASAVIVLLNMLIAMMSRSFDSIQVN